MSESGGEEQSEQSLQPLKQEVVSTEQYQRSLELLRRFAAKDATEIATLDALSFEVGFVGRGLHNVIVSHGEIKKTDAFDKSPITEYKIQKPDEEVVTIASSGQGQVTLDQFRLVNRTRFSKYAVSLPISGGITVNNKPFHKANIAYAADRRGEKSVSYSPAKDPNNPDVLQGYTRLLQEGVKEVLSSLG